MARPCPVCGVGQPQWEASRLSCRTMTSQPYSLVRNTRAHGRNDVLKKDQVGGFLPLPDSKTCKASAIGTGLHWPKERPTVTPAQGPLTTVLLQCGAERREQTCQSLPEDVTLTPPHTSRLQVQRRPRQE